MTNKPWSEDLLDYLASYLVDNGYDQKKLIEHIVASRSYQSRAVALSVALGSELSKAVRGIPESDLALPFSEPAPIVAHGLLRRLAPLMLMVYRRRDIREIA